MADASGTFDEGGRAAKSQTERDLMDGCQSADAAGRCRSVRPDRSR